MFAHFQRPQWRRIYRQTITLTHKNLLVFYKTALTTFLRALLFPIAITLIVCYLRYISASSSSDFNGIAPSSNLIKDLADAIYATSSHRLVFVRNGISDESLNQVIQGISQQQGMHQQDTVVVDDPDDLFNLCQQSLQGLSDCFAAVIFLSFNETNVEYIIALDDHLPNSFTENYNTHQSLLADRLLPIQWAIDSHIGNFSTISKPSELPWSGYFGPSAPSFVLESEKRHSIVGGFWLSLTGSYAAPIYFLILIGVVYHLTTFVASERQSSMADLMAAQMVTTVPRILSTNVSFLILYAPGFVICSILLTQLLFTHTSDILFLVHTLLAGGSMVASSHFLGSFFSKAQIAGLYSSVFAFVLALINLASSLTIYPKTPQVLSLSLIFPPVTWVTFISDVASLEANGGPFYLNRSQQDSTPMDAKNYLIFFVVQIIVYTAATYFVEQKLWGVKRNYDLINSSSDISLRCTALSKTYLGKRRWYWPFVRKGMPLAAVDTLNLEVKKGSVTFLLGPNGGGKSTILKCVSGMTSMDAGSLLELNEAGQVFGICPQSNVFWDNLTVQEHIQIWRKLKTSAYNDLSIDEDDVLAECDLFQKAKAPAKTLSGGQKRKLQLAIAFVGGSNVCCIDEASSGLDPLSRRNIWNIIQKGQSRRTILITTHFLDEADVLADHIAIVYKGRLVCEGPGTSLKARFGEEYIIRNDSDFEEDNVVWRMATSAQATRKLIELESLSEDNTYNVQFPTLEQVFLKVTSDSHTAIHENGGDGIVGEEEPITAIDEKILALETEAVRDIDLDFGHSVGLVRQVMALFRKRYILLRQRSNWISYGINLIIPIVAAAAMFKFIHKIKPLQTCQVNLENLRAASAQESTATSSFVFAPLTSSLPIYFDTSDGPSVIVGPEPAWTGSVQDDLYVSALLNIVSLAGFFSSNNTDIVQLVLDTRQMVNTSQAVVDIITEQPLTISFALFAATPETGTLFYNTEPYQSPYGMTAFSLLTNRISNSTKATNSGPTGTARTTTAKFRTMRHVDTNVDTRTLPIAILLILAFITAASISVIYPTFEKINNVRALHYCNGVSPFALWFAYLLFDTQFIIVQAVIVWGILFSGILTTHWYGPGYFLGVFVLFGIATYLGTYLVSLFVKKAAFAIAAGVHILLFVLYFVAYVMNQAFGDIQNLQQTYTYLQYGLGLSSPAANLARAFFVGTNSFDVLCGKYGVADTTKPFAYVRYGSVYVNLIIQIVFLITAISVYEYGSADWERRNVTHRGVPARLHYIIDSGEAPTGPSTAAVTEKDARALATTVPPPILQVSRVSKFFGRIFATENISFNISANETLALLGGNGAGKTTVINMIRGELKPDYGDISLNGISVRKQPHKARLQMGVCPQDDAVDNLTVRQTLNFYAQIKGLRNVPGNVDKVMNALNISMYENYLVKDLSGGTKRKLSVAIALLGNPRVLLLDEPSTGQDAGAKRILWKALQEVKGNRAILLTTHSMEEAETLATNVAIIGTRMLAEGTLSSLQETYGGAFNVKAICAYDISAAQVEEMIRTKFEGGVSNYADSHGQISFNLPHDKKKLGSFMLAMEELKGESIVDRSGCAGDAGGSAAGGSSSAEAKPRVQAVRDYIITGPTLEEVFMNVAKAANAGDV